jgi:dolichol-phosphate mannosyltransferase
MRTEQALRVVRRATDEGQGDQPVASARPVELTIIVPTYNERDNIELIVERVDRVLTAISWEIVFVDDSSRDGTGDKVRSIARQDRRVRLIERHNRRGLSSAVVEGALAASAEIIAVMDGDLQHDEGLLPRLYEVVASGEAAIASASRFLGHDGHAGLENGARAKMSDTGIALANRLFGLNMTDPLTGFFAMRRETFVTALPDLSERGFKILLDVIISMHPRPTVKELGFQFRQRERGASKLDRRVLYDFLLLFIEKTCDRFVHIPGRFLSFSIINGLGMMLHVAVFVAASNFTDFLGAQLIATIASVFFNFSLNNWLTYSDQTLKGARFWLGLLVFTAVCSIGIAANVGIASLLHRDFERLLHIVPAVAGALITLVWNYATTKLFVWGRERSSIAHYVEARSNNA